MRRHMIAAAVAAALGCGLAPTAPADTGADPAVERGHAIYAERERRDDGFGDQRVDMRMTLRDASGRTAGRELTVTESEGAAGGGDKAVIVFSAPPDIADTALLTHERAGAADDDQWLFLPAYKRTRRVASRDRSGRFVGTEFSYEDLAGDQLEDFRYRYIREDRVDGRPAHLIERIPTNPSSAYSRQETWVDAVTNQVVKARLYDRKGRHVKTLEAGDWRQYRGRYWRPHRVRMSHVESGRTTEMIASTYRFGTGVSPKTFKAAALGR